MSIKNALVGVALVAGLLTGSANAATYSWTFSCDTPESCSGSGLLETSGPIGPTLITSISGTWATQTIDQLLTPNSFPAGLANNNVINSLTELTFEGLSFSVVGGLLVNLYSSDDGFDRWYTSVTQRGEVGTFVATPFAPPIPIPAALPLLASGLGALGFIGWRRKRKAA